MRILLTLFRRPLLVQGPAAGGRARKRPVRWPLVVALLLAATLLLAACAGQVPFLSDPAATGYPLTITDDRGVEVTLAAEPQRIIAVGPSHTELLFAIGAGEKVVAVDDFSNRPGAVAELPRVGGITDPDRERVVGHEPDLVLVLGLAHDHAASLEELGLTVAVLDAANLDAMWDKIRRLGLLVNRQSEAADLIAELEASFAEVQAAIGDLSPELRPRVYHELWHDPLIAAGSRSFVHDLIELAQGENIFADIEDDWPLVSAETVVERDPQVITVTQDFALEELREASREGWAEISAVRDGRVALVDDDLLHRPGPRIDEGLRQLAAAIHPAAFELDSE